MKKILLLLVVLCCFLQTIMAQNTRNTHFSISSNNEIFYTLFTKDYKGELNEQEIWVNHRGYDTGIDNVKVKRFYNVFNWRKDLLFSLYFNHWRIYTGIGYEEKNIAIDNTEDTYNGKITSIRFHQEALTLPLGIGYFREMGTNFLYGGNIGVEIGVPIRLTSTLYYSQKLTPTGHFAYLEMADVPDEYYSYFIRYYYNLSTFLNFEIGYKMNSFCNVYLGLNCKYLTYSLDEDYELLRESHSSDIPQVSESVFGYYGGILSYPLGSYNYKPPFTLGLNLKVEVKI